MIIIDFDRCELSNRLYYLNVVNVLGGEVFVFS